MGMNHVRSLISKVGEVAGDLAFLLRFMMGLH
jgi:hypothetical protein